MTKPRAHDLVPRAAEVPDGGTPDVNEPSEGEEQKDRHTQQEMQLEDRIDVGDIGGGRRLQAGDARNRASPTGGTGLYARSGFERRGPFGGYWNDPLSVFMQKRIAAWTVVANVLLNLDEFLTRG